MTDIPTFDNPTDYEPPPARPFKLTGALLAPEPSLEEGGDPVERWEETFSVLGEIPQGALSDLGAAVTITDGELIYSSAAVIRYLRAALVPMDLVRFDALLRDKNRLCPLEQLGNVMFWCTGIQMGRPTGPQPTSTDGLRETGHGSEDGSHSPDTPPSGSAD